MPLIQKLHRQANSAGKGPVLVELHTTRLEAHTNADDHLRYRSKEELEAIAHEDAVARLEKYLRSRDLLDDAVVEPTIERALDALAARCTVTGQELRPGF